MKTVVCVWLVLFSVAAAPHAKAKQYSTCDAAYQFYLHDHSLHKAFATTNGILPDHGNAMCGGSSGDDPGRAVFAALDRCNQQSKKAHYSGSCKVISKQ